jgi:hypothetical protein
MITRTGPVSGLPPAHIFFFTLALAFALAVVLVPVLPGETPLSEGDVAFRTFRTAAP